VTTRSILYDKDDKPTEEGLSWKVDPISLDGDEGDLATGRRNPLAAPSSFATRAELAHVIVPVPEGDRRHRQGMSSKATSLPLSLAELRELGQQLRVDSIRASDVNKSGIGDKRAYDPRTWSRSAEQAMAARVVEACQRLGSAGRSLAGHAPRPRRA